MLEKQQPVNPKLIPILMHGTSVGGARPKCLIEMNQKAYIAKFSLSVDQHAFIKHEFIAMRLATKMGLTVAPVLLKSISGRDILLLVFNVLIGNTDDHARNHAAFWDGQYLTLTPAYDLLPQVRIGHEATQAMMVEGESGNVSTLKNILSIHQHFLLAKDEAIDIIQKQINALDTHWQSICDEANLTTFEHLRLWGNTVKSEYCMQGWLK
jgi:hypothetical protein